MRDDLIRVTNPQFKEYRDLRDSGASHEAALAAMECRASLQYQQRMFERTERLIADMDFS